MQLNKYFTYIMYIMIMNITYIPMHTSTKLANSPFPEDTKYTHLTPLNTRTYTYNELSIFFIKPILR